MLSCSKPLYLEAPHTTQRTYRHALATNCCRRGSGARPPFSSCPPAAAGCRPASKPPPQSPTASTAKALLQMASSAHSGVSQSRLLQEPYGITLRRAGWMFRRMHVWPMKTICCSTSTSCHWAYCPSVSTVLHSWVQCTSTQHHRSRLFGRWKSARHLDVCRALSPVVSSERAFVACVRVPGMCACVCACAGVYGACMCV